MNIPYLVILRVHIIFFWLVIIFLFLFFPSLSRLWQPRRAINIMTWTDILDPTIIDQFEQETGITVNLSYFESNEELYVRFRATEGRGHDLIVPSDYTVELLIQDDLLKPLDKTKLTIWPRLDPRLLGLFYDPENKYSIPYYWAVYGIGYNKRYFGGIQLPASWALIFNEDIAQGPLAMSDAAREAVLIGAFYLFGDIDNLDEKKLKQVKNLLLKQKKLVGAYTESRTDYLLITGEFPMAVTQTPLVWRMLKRYPHLKFSVPQEGTFVIVDNFAISKQSTNEELVYQFLNFIYQAKNIRYHFEQHRFFPATIDLNQLMKEHDVDVSVVNAHTIDSSKWNFFKNTISTDVVEDIWVAVKSQ